jgi:hypothetical protein
MRNIGEAGHSGGREVELVETSAVAASVMQFVWEERLQKITRVIARLALAFLFFSQLFWKLPPRFGCGPGPGFEFTHYGPDGTLVRTSGICDWVGIQATFADHDRKFFAAWTEDGDSLFSISLKPLTRLNGLFAEKVVQPNMGVFGWGIFFAEAFIAVSLFLGLFSRAGALVSLLVSFQLMLGLAGVWDPAAHLNEWEWSYHLMVFLSFAVLGAAPGRVFGLDMLLRPRLAAAASSGNRVAKLLLAAT